MFKKPTSVIFEGTPFHPDNDRFWQIIAKYAVSKFYTAPTAIRDAIQCCRVIHDMTSELLMIKIVTTFLDLIVDNNRYQSFFGSIIHNNMIVT